MQPIPNPDHNIDGVVPSDPSWHPEVKKIWEAPEGADDVLIADSNNELFEAIDNLLNHRSVTELFDAGMKRIVEVIEYAAEDVAKTQGLPADWKSHWTAPKIIDPDVDFIRQAMGIIPENVGIDKPFHVTGRMIEEVHWYISLYRPGDGSCECGWVQQVQNIFWIVRAFGREPLIVV